MRGSLHKDRDAEGRDTGAVENDGHVVQVLEDMDAESVHQSVADQQSRIDSDDFRGRGLKATFDRGKGGYEVRTTKCNACGNGDCQRLLA